MQRLQASLSQLSKELGINPKAVAKRRKRVAIVRMRSHKPTLVYVKKRTRDGKSKSEIIRCLKRYIVCETYSQLRLPKSAEKVAWRL